MFKNGTGNGRAGGTLPTVDEVDAYRQHVEDANPEAASAFPGVVAAQLCLHLGMSPAMSTKLRNRKDIDGRRIVREWADLLADTSRRDKVGTLVARLGLSRKVKA